jgi:hypothetical protein
MTLPAQGAIADRVLPPMDGDDWIHLVVRFSERIRTRHRLAEADR